MRAIVEFITGRRTAWITLAGCLLAVILTIALVPAPSTATQGAPTTAGDSQQVAALLADFPAPKANYAVIVWDRPDGAALTSAQRASIQARVPALTRLSDQTSTSRAQIAVNRKAMLFEVYVNSTAGDHDAATLVPRLRTAASDGLPSSLRAQLTGSLVTTADNEASQASLRLWLLLLSGLVVAALCLLLTRSVLVWIAQVVVIAASSWFGLVVGGAVSADLGIPFSTSAGTSVACLLLIASAGLCVIVATRYRRALRAAPDATTALRSSLPGSAAAVATSAIVLAIALLALLFTRDSDAHAIAVPGAIGVVLAAILALVLLPALVAVIGRAAPAQPAPGPSPETRTRPVPLGLTTGAVLGLLTLILVATQLGLTAATSPQPDAQAAAAQRATDDDFGVGLDDQAIMLVPNSLSGETSTVAPTTLAMVYDTVHAVTLNGSVAGRSELIVTMDVDPESPQAAATIDKLRAKIAQTGGPTAGTLVGGTDAATIDSRQAASADLGVVIPIIAVVLLVLLAGTLLVERRRRPSA